MTSQDKTSLITIIVSIIGIILIFKSCDISSPSSSYSSYDSKLDTTGIEILSDKWCYRHDNTDCSICGEILNNSNSSKSIEVVYKVYDKEGYQECVANGYARELSPHTKAKFRAPCYCGGGKGKYVREDLKLY